MSATITEREADSLTEWNDDAFDHYYFAPDYKFAACGHVRAGELNFTDLPLNEPCPICLSVYNYE